MQLLSVVQKKAVVPVKLLLVNEPVYSLPLAVGHLKMDTDASCTQLDYIWLQEPRNKIMQLLRYSSRTVPEPEKEPGTTLQECFRVANAVLLLRSYIEGRRSNVRMKLEVFEWVLDMKEATRKLHHWWPQLLNFFWYRPSHGLQV